MHLLLLVVDAFLHFITPIELLADGLYTHHIYILCP